MAPHSVNECELRKWILERTAPRSFLDPAFVEDLHGPLATTSRPARRVHRPEERTPDLAGALVGLHLPLK